MKKLPLLYGIYGNIKKEELLYKVERSVLGGVEIFQLREKKKDREEIKEIAFEIKKLCKAYNVIFIINDDIELCQEIGADGVHIGKEDADIEEAVKELKNKIIGVSCYNEMERALYAQEKGASYISFSSPFDSPTKTQKPYTDFDFLKKAKKILRIPFYVIGGINSKTLPLLFSHVKCGVCSISGIYGEGDPFLNAFEMKEFIIENTK